MKKKIIVNYLSLLWLIGILVMFYVKKEVDVLWGQGLMSYETSALLTKQILQGISSILFLVSLLSLLWIKSLFKHVVDPIKELTEEAEAFGRNKHTHILRQYELEEVNALANAFDKMSERFHRTVRKLEYQKRKAESVLSHIEDGIIILDEEGYIVEYNAFATDYLELPKDFRKCHIKYLIREETCQNALVQALEKGIKSSCELLKDGRIFHIRISLITGEESRYGYIVTITDMTKTRQLEALRYQFVTNVTHELKTPLTSIQGFVETLQNGALENPTIAKRFLAIIDIETKRLYRLIQDVLILSEIENMDSICGGSVKLKELAEEVRVLLNEEARKKDIQIVLDIKEDVVLENVSYDHMKQVVVNLMSNAIKYTDVGKVTLYIGQEGNKPVFYVKDTGIGIPKKDFEKIFERFYRVDKSRTRKSGGTGLGLSIVKHIVQLYHWTIEVESEEQKGSTFKIIF